ncbi:DUF2384 domain-containing protein [Paraburkholderia megapolitana]|uniref:DUF2384 domain-containing protein n=1 Tax=Paraburkholderia megapolitana TaxID=420953 RepID=UPI000B895CD0|nr:DUF2384 domain-containing protein [Paraburkholderia megapolitana]QDQ84775.1 DUF2384 domain-containing protein [Paraburkholderia megapolitana]
MPTSTDHFPGSIATFDQFMESLRDPTSAVPIISARRFADALHINMQVFAQQARVHCDVVRCSPESASVQSFLREALRVIRAAVDVRGDVSATLFWYRNQPLVVFDYKTAERLVSEGRADDLLRYVLSLEAGMLG